MDESLTLEDKKQIVLNSDIELGEQEGNGKGRYFISRFIEPGIAHYKELGDILITKETLNKFIDTMVGCPVIIEHEDVTDENADKLRVGVVSRVWFNEADGYFYCEGILTDPEAIDLVKNQGYNVSCAYSFVSDNTKRTHNGKEIDMEFIDGEFLHLALVKDPRYEGANIVVNSEDFEEEEHPRNKIGEFVKKLNEKGYPAKEDDFVIREGKSEFTYENGTEDRRPLVKEDKAYMFPEHELRHYAHEYGHLFAQRNKEYFDLFKNQVGELNKFIDDNYEKLKKLDSAISDYEELFAEAVSWDVRNIDMEQSKIIRKIFNLDKIVNNNIGDTVMQVLNELKDFIKSVVNNEKEEEMKEEVKNEDKRELIDEVGGILKGKVDDEIIRTVIGKLEKIAYEPSEDDKADNKAKNEEDEEKEAENKCKNEEEEPKEDVTKNEEKPEDKKEDKEEDKPEDKAENKKVKNSMKDMVMGGSSNVQEQKLYISRKERLEEGNKY